MIIDKARHEIEDAFHTYTSSQRLTQLLDAYKIEVLENHYVAALKMMASTVEDHFKFEYPDQYKTGVMAAVKYLRQYAADIEAEQGKQSD